MLINALYAVCSVTQLCPILCNPMDLSMEFSSQEYWHGLPFPPPRARSNPEIEPASLASPVLAGGVFFSPTTATAKSLQSCPTWCNPIPGILQTRTLEWVAISFSNA